MLKKLYAYIPITVFFLGFALMIADLPRRFLVDAFLMASVKVRRRTQMDWQFGWARFHAWYLFILMGIKMPIHVEESVRAGKPYILIANHRSVLDPLIMAQVQGRLNLRSVFWGIKREMGKVFVLGGSFVRAGFALLSRKSDPCDKDRLRTMAQLAAQEKASAALFAEGTRHDGIRREGSTYQYLRVPKRGGLQILMDELPDHPIVFVCIDWRGLRGGKKFFDAAGLLGTQGQVTVWQHNRTPGEDAQTILDAGWSRMDMLITQPLRDM